MMLQENDHAGDDKINNDTSSVDDDLVHVEEVNEEGKTLQEQLDVYVRQLEESDAELYLPALEALQNHLKNFASSTTSGPKPLELLLPHYEVLKSLSDKMPTDETKKLLEDIVSILSVTTNTEAPKTNDEPIKYQQVAIIEDVEDDDDDEDDDEFFEDETLAERLWGLTEMFPEKVRDVTWTVSTSSISCAKGLYQLSRGAIWIIATSAIILAGPALIENEKAQLDELNRQQQRQILLGPSASMSGAPGLSPTLTPPQPR